MGRGRMSRRFLAKVQLAPKFQHQHIIPFLAAGHIPDPELQPRVREEQRRLAELAAEPARR